MAGENGPIDCNVSPPGNLMTKELLLQDPKETTDEEKEAVKFLYQRVIPVVAKADMKSVQPGDTYYKAFGDNWKLHMAVAFILLEHYSGMDNIKENVMNKTDKKRKRGRLNTKKSVEDLGYKYYSHLGDFDSFGPDKEESLAKWDALHNLQFKDTSQEDDNNGEEDNDNNKMIEQGRQHLLNLLSAMQKPSDGQCAVGRI